MTASRQAIRNVRASVLAAVLGVLGRLAPPGALAQGASGMLSAADRAEIVNFKLDQDVLVELEAVTVEGRAMRIGRRRPDMSTVHSLEDMAAQLVAVDPRIQPLLTRHGFTPHQFVVANLTLVRTAMAVRMQDDPHSVRYPGVMSVDSGNVAFYKAHEAQIARMLGGGAP